MPSEKPWEDFEDHGGWDDECSLMNVPAKHTLGDGIRTAGFLILLELLPDEGTGNAG